MWNASVEANALVISRSSMTTVAPWPTYCSVAMKNNSVGFSDAAATIPDSPKATTAIHAMNV